MDETATTIQCKACPRPGRLWLRAVRNYGRAGGYLLENVYLCDSCAILEDDIL